MGIETIAALNEELVKNQLLEPAQLSQVARLQAQGADPRALARELIQRGWLTPYQVNQLFTGHGKDLVLGHYILLERLGEGGMGQVFKARHAKLGRVVALKVIRKDKLTDPEAVGRFRREMQAVAQLKHPNVVAALDADQADDALFLVMELVEGIDLGRLVRERGPLPPATACEYIRQAALGLQHAHEKGLVHRDIKPSNLLVSGGVVSGESKPPFTTHHSPFTTHHSPFTTHVVKILDLGLARLHHDPGDDPSALTQMGIVVGTPDYMSPEQARNASRADIRSDLYSLGCTFYFLLTGQVPFAGATATEKLIKHCFEPPPPLEKLRPDIPPRVCKVVEKLMAKQPEERYPTPAKLVVALSRPGLLSRPLTRPLTKFLRGMLGQDPPLRPDAPERLRKAAQRRRWLRLNILGGLALAVLLLLFGILLWTSGSSTPTGKASLPSPRSTRLAADLLDPKGIPPEERFAWQPNELVAVLGKHRARTWGQVHVLTISADSQMLACGASDGSVHLFDATTLVEQAVIREENYGSIWAIAFAPDGKTLAFAGFDGNIYLWEPSRPKPVRKGVLKGHRNTVIALAFSPDSQTLASGSSDATLRLWDLGRPDRPEFANVKADESAVHAIAFGPDGKTLVTGGRDRKVRLWDLAGGKLTERWAVAGHQDTISTVAFVARGDRVVSSSHGRYIRVWDAADGKQVSFTDVSRGNNPTGVFSPDGHLFAAGAGGSPTRIWDLAGGEPRDRLNLGPQSQGSYVMAFAPNNKALVTAGFHRLNLWDLSGGKPRLALSSRDDAVDVRSVALASDGRTLATGGYNGRLRLWDLAATEPVERSAHEPHNRTIGAVEFSPDGKLLVSAGQDSTLRVWDVSGSRFVEVGKFTDFNNSVTSAAFAGDGKLLAGGSQDRTVRLYDVAAGKVTLRGELTHSDPVNAVALDANGHTLVCLVGDQLRGHTLRLWDLTPARPRVRADLRPPRGFWTKMALSPDGRTLAAGTGNGALRLWDLGAADPRDRREWPIPGARGAVSALALSPDGQLLAASVPGRLVVWDLGAMKMIRDWELPGTVEDLAFGPEGRHLITANANGTVYILRLSSPR